MWNSVSCQMQLQYCLLECAHCGPAQHTKSTICFCFEKDAGEELGVLAISESAHLHTQLNMCLPSSTLVAQCPSAEVSSKIAKALQAFGFLSEGCGCRSTPCLLFCHPPNSLTWIKVHCFAWAWNSSPSNPCDALSSHHPVHLQLGQQTQHLHV